MKPLSLGLPHFIIMVGIPGSGKSFFAEHFAETFKAPIVSYDRLRKELFNSPTHSKIENSIISQVANYMLDEVLKTGRTVVFDGQSDLRNDRELFAKKSREAGYEPMFVWVQTEPIDAKKRALKSKPGKPGLAVEQFEMKLKQFSIPHNSEKTIVISGKHTYTTQLKIVLKNLIDPRTQLSENAHNPR